MLEILENNWTDNFGPLQYIHVYLTKLSVPSSSSLAWKPRKFLNVQALLYDVGLDCLFTCLCNCFVHAISYKRTSMLGRLLILDRDIAACMHVKYACHKNCLQRDRLYIWHVIVSLAELGYVTCIGLCIGYWHNRPTASSNFCNTQLSYCKAKIDVVILQRPTGYSIP